MRLSLALLAGGTLAFLLGLALLSIPIALMATGVGSVATGLLLNIPESTRG